MDWVHGLCKFFGWPLHRHPLLHAKVKPLPLFYPFLFKCKMNHHCSAFLPCMYITKSLFLGESVSCLESSTQFSRPFWLSCQTCLCEMTSFYISAVTYLWNIFYFMMETKWYVIPYHFKNELKKDFCFSFSPCGYLANIFQTLQIYCIILEFVDLPCM